MDGPIGVFDSGVGGLTVVRQLLLHLPQEDLLYLGDTARMPYGPRPQDEVCRYVLEVVEFMEARGAKALVIAGNTATVAGLEAARARAPFPVAGVIEPGARMAVGMTRGRIGLLATEGTVKSGAYQRRLQELVPGLEVIAHGCPKFAPLVEAGLDDERAIQDAVAEYVGPLARAKVDTVILGCTHYPLLARWIQAYLGDEVMLVDPALATVEILEDELGARGLLLPPGRQGYRQFATTGEVATFGRVAAMILDMPELQAVRVRLGE
ncbi:MAG: glutamate racemase [Bacillota bacterium]